MCPAHYHLLFLDGVYVWDDSGEFVFHYNKAPTVEQLTDVLHTISQRVANYLGRQGLLERDEDNSYLSLDGLDEDPLHDIHTHSVTYRVAMGPQRGRKVFTLQTIPPRPDLPPGSDRVAKLAGFSLHAGVAARAYQRKTPYRNGTTHVIFEPVDFVARLAALVPKPGVNLTRFHGVFAPNSKHRIQVTPAKRGKGRKELERQPWDEKTPLERHAAMTWPFSHIHVLHGT